jgi:hypothetical protein
MSPREKKLLAFGFYQTKSVEMNRALQDARQKLDTAEMFRASREQVTDQMDWLASRQPEPAANQDVQTKLQQLCETEAKSTGLEIKNQRPLPTDTTSGIHYHRAKIQLTVSGTEEALYRWFDRLNVPDQFRAATVIRLSPNAKDDTKIDCTATVEQWFVPQPPA